MKQILYKLFEHQYLGRDGSTYYPAKHRTKEI